MRPVPQVLIPWNPQEALTVREAAAIARKSPRTIHSWAANHDIGRRVGGGDWMISHPALLMFLEDDRTALSAYLTGERATDRITAYFHRSNVNF